MLIDSDVLVWLTRGNVRAAQRLQQLAVWRISTVTYIELAQGCRDKLELAQLKKGLAMHGTEVVPITPAISERAASSLLAGKTYFNIHTTAFSGGEIRGFLIPTAQAVPEPATLGLLALALGAVAVSMRRQHASMGR